MGDVTVPDNLPYPFDSDTPDVPRDISALAEATQAALLKYHFKPQAVGVRTDVDLALTAAALWKKCNPWTVVENQMSGTDPIPYTIGDDLTIQDAGIYHIDFSASVVSSSGDNSAGLRINLLTPNSTLFYGNGVFVKSGLAGATTMRHTAMVHLVAGQQVTGWVRLESGTGTCTAAALRLLRIT